MERNPLKKSKVKLTRVSILHYLRLVYRSMLLGGAIIWYIIHKVEGKTISFRNQQYEFILFAIWIVFMAEMVLRIFPSKLESPGCQKQFARNYMPTGRTDVKLHDNHAVMIVALIWVVANLPLGALRMTHVVDDGLLLLISLAYSACDMICILFFCPFQTWFLKNRCCSSCRIYNWDYAMMFTPLFFIPSVYTWTLVIVAIVILGRWEITLWQYPERFSENTNAYLSCASCTEKLCTHKKQLNQFRKDLIRFAEKQNERILTFKKNDEA